MAQYITKIRTEDGDKQIDYNALANKPTYETLGAAPDGFGLGEQGQKNDSIECTTIEQLNERVENGFWAYRNGEVPLLANDSNTSFVKGITLAYNDDCIVQIGFCNLIPKYPKCIIREKHVDWGEWVHVNPPMEPGKVYRTMETLNGKLVYKTLDEPSGKILCSTDDGATWVDQATFIGAMPLDADFSVPTYTLTKSGNTITLNCSDGSTTSVTDSNTTYSLGDFGVTATAAELNYVGGVKSSIQTQLNEKAATSHKHNGSDITSGYVSTTRGGTGATDGATGLKNLFAAGYTKVSSYQYGDDFPTNYTHSSNTKGTIFFKKVSS